MEKGRACATTQHGKTFFGIEGEKGGREASDEPQRNSKFLGAGQIVLLLTREKDVRVVTSVL